LILFNVQNQYYTCVIYLQLTVYT